MDPHKALAEALAVQLTPLDASLITQQELDILVNNAWCTRATLRAATEEKLERAGLRPGIAALLAREFSSVNADIATKIDDLTTKVASLAAEVALVHSGEFFKQGVMEQVEKCLVVLDFQQDDPSKCKELNATQLQEMIESRSGKSKAAKLGPAQFNCVGVVFNERGLICTTRHALHQMMQAKQGRNAKKGDMVLVYAPAFGPEKGVLQCSVEVVSRSRDFVLLRANPDNLKDEGPGSYFLPVCKQGQVPRKTQQVAIVSGRIYISKQDKQPVSVAFDVGRIYSYTEEEVQVTCQSFPGDSGAGIVMVDGKLLGMHTEEQNSSELNVSESGSGHSYTHASRALLAYHMLPSVA